MHLGELASIAIGYRERDCFGRLIALARLASNFCRRRVPDEELHESLVFLVGKCGMKAEDIANATGISVRTIYRHMPQEMKKPEAEAISQGMKE